VRRLLAGLPSSSYFALYDGTNVVSKAFEQAQEGYNRNGAAPASSAAPSSSPASSTASSWWSRAWCRARAGDPDPADAAGSLPAEVNAFGGVGRKP
jgi:hypothetical protein